MLSSIKPKIEPVIQTIAKPFYKVNPNVLTFLGLIPPLVYLFLMVNGYYLWAIIALIGSTFDMLDGAVARATNRVTKFGGVLDSTVDRASDAIIIASFGFAGLADWSLVISLLVLSYLISYIRSRAELAGEAKFKLDVGILERTERLAGLGIITLLTTLGWDQVLLISGNFVMSLIDLAFWIMIILSLVTVVQRLKVSHEKLA